MVERGTRARGRAARWLAPAALFAAAVAIRLLPWRTVFVGEGILLVDHDSYYHLRRIVWSVIHFPAALGFDSYLNFPEGGRAIWTPCFDWLVALLALPLAEPRLSSIERVAVFVPPLLGGATVVALHALARRHFDAGTALLAGALLAVLSAHFWYSQLGFVDHHAAEALCATLLFAAAMGLLDREARGQGLFRPALGLGLALAAALLVWPGSLLHVAIAEGGLLVALATRSGAARAVGFARAFAGAQAVALAALLPFALTAEPSRFGPWSPLVLSRFQPLAFAALALVGLGCGGLWRRRPALAAHAGARLACVGLPLLALAAAVLPELVRGTEDAYGWLARRELFQAQVAESHPLLAGPRGFDASVAALRLSWFVFASPIALIAATAWAWRRPVRAPLLLWLAWTAVLLAATLLQRRFFNAFSVPFALLFAFSVRAVDARLAAAFGRRPPLRRACRAALAAAVLVCLLPVVASYWLPVAALLDDPQRGSLLVTPGRVRRWAMLELAIWLRLRTPPTAGWLDPAREPEYGVLGPWELGHILQYVARRPAVVDNFGDDVGERGFEQARRYYASAEPAASRILDELRVRYVIAQRQAPFLGPEPDERSMFTSLFDFDGGEHAGAEGGEPLPALERHRLVYESAQKVAAAPDAQSFYKVFEHVAGAQIEGRARPGARVEARLGLRTNRGRELVHRAQARADAAGRYRLRLPYATSGAPPAVRTDPVWWLECEGERAPLSVLEAQVQAGAALEGPALCLGAAAGEAEGPGSDERARLR